MTTQTEQTEFFPMTQLDIAEAFLQHFETEVEKTTKAMSNAQAKVAEALKLREMAEHEVARHAGESVMQEAADIVNSGALDYDGTTVTASTRVVGPLVTNADFTDEVAAELDARGVEYQRDQPLPAVDPITGEVETQASGVTCDNCVNDDCNLRQREGTRQTGCDGAGWRPPEPTDPITGEVAPAAVVALYPGDGDGHETQVGDRTRYGELVADYFTAAGLHDEHAEDWEVRAVRELQDGGGYRSLHDIIIPADYGQELLVVALDQGSVVGASAEKVAT